MCLPEPVGPSSLALMTVPRITSSGEVHLQDQRQGRMSGESRCIFLRDSSASLRRLLLLVSYGESL